MSFTWTCNMSPSKIVIQKKKKRDHKVEYRHLTPISGIMSDIRILNDQFLRWFQPSGTHTTLA